jgi:serine/threonine protein kinase
MFLDTDTMVGERYELGEALGHGRATGVHSAHDRVLGLDVAVKRFDPGLYSTSSALARFDEQAHATATLSHPNLVTVLDVGVDGETPFVVMERLSGGTLADELQAGPLPVPRAVRLVREMLAGLAAAHDRGVLHRDLKPSNVLITSDDHVKLTDVGMTTRHAIGTLDLTDGGPAAERSPYLAPERLSGAPASARSDLYSVGVIAYEALSGETPAAASSFGGDTRSTRPLRELRPELPEAVCEVVARALTPEPTMRFRAAREFDRYLGAAAEALTAA